MLNSVLKIIRGIVKLRGDSDDSLIGNVGDRLKVDVQGASGNGGQIDPVPGQDIFHAAKKLENAGSSDMTVDGSSTAVDFTAGPSGGEVWYVWSVSFYIEDAGSADSTDFGSIVGSLTNGVEISFKSKGNTRTAANMKNNIDIVHCFAGSSGTNTSEESVGFLDEDDLFFGQWMLPIPVKLDAANSDEVKFKVQDDLTNVDQMSAVIHYWIVN